MFTFEHATSAVASYTCASSMAQPHDSPACTPHIDALIAALKGKAFALRDPVSCSLIETTRDRAPSFDRMGAPRASCATQPTVPRFVNVQSF